MNDIFLRIARGEIDAHTVFESNDVMGILDIAPAAPGHTILFPKEPHQVLAQVPNETRVSLVLALKHIRRILAKLEGVTGMTSVIHQGPAAGQRAPHLLIHTIPRREGDGLFTLPEEGATPEPEDHPMFTTDDPLITISEPVVKRARGERMLIDASVDLFEELSPERIARFSELIDSVTKHVFEETNAQGTTILIESGSSQSALGAQANIIPRWENDGLDLLWESHEASDLREMRDAIVRSLDPEPKAMPSEPKTENYLLKQLTRIP